MSRVNPHGLTAAARSGGKWVVRIGVGLAVLIVLGVLFSFFLSATNDVRTERTVTADRQVVITNQTVPAIGPCSGEVLTVRLSAGQVFRPHPACSFTFKVMAGKVNMRGDNGLNVDWEVDQPPMGEVKGRVRRVTALSQEAEVDYMFCSTSKQVVGWECV